MDNLIFALIVLLGGHISFYIFSARVFVLDEISFLIAVWTAAFGVLLIGSILLLFFGVSPEKCCTMIFLLTICGVLQKKAEDNLYDRLIYWLVNNPCGVLSVTETFDDGTQRGRVVIAGQVRDVIIGTGGSLAENRDYVVGFYIQLGKNKRPESLRAFLVN